MQTLMDAIIPSIGAALVLFLWALYRGTRVALLAVGVSSTLVAGTMLYVCWFFRDGLGPDSVTSYGLDALLGIAPVLLMAGMAWAMANGLAYLRFRENRSPRASQLPEGW